MNMSRTLWLALALALGPAACDLLSSATASADAEEVVAEPQKVAAASTAPAAAAPAAAKLVAPPAVEPSVDRVPPPKVEAPVVVPPADPPTTATPDAPPRPKTMADARQRLLEISKSHELGRLASLVGADGRIEHAHRHERQRVRRTIGRAPDAAAFTEMFGEREPWAPIQYVAALTADTVDDAQLTVVESTLTVEYRPDGQFWIDFVFEKSGDELALVRIATFDEEP